MASGVLSITSVEEERMLAQGGDCRQDSVAKAAVILNNRMGLHCRTAGAFVRVAKTFRSQLKVRHAKQEVDGKSILGVMGLGAGRGALLFLEAAGDDAHEAIDALRTLVDNKLGEPS